MKLQRFTVLALVAMCTVASVFAAGGKGDQAAGKKKIVIFQSKVEITSQLEAAAKAYTAETGVEVEVWGTTGDDYFQQFKMRIANNQGPTIFNLGSETEIAQVGNYCADLGGLSFLPTISNEMLGKFNNKVIGIPYTVEGFGMVYNKKLINPATVNDYASFVQMLQASKAQGVNGFGLSQESYFLIGHILNHPFSLISDMTGYMDKLNKGQVKMADTPEFQEFARFYAAIRDNSYNPLEVNYEKECGDFATGKTASIHQGNWAYNMFSSYTVDFEMGLMPFPLMGNDRLAVSVPSYWCVNSQVPAAEQEEGKKFLTWLYATPAGQRILTDSFGFIPVVKGVTSTKLDPLSAEVARYAQEGKTRPWATSYYPAGSVDVHFVPVAQRFFTSQMTPEEFLAAMDKAWAAANGR
jgi:raffinose/stachyose/melibiose transport system substrate-binding protein